MKTVIGIFAHPDDEALGPSGTLALLAQDHDVYLICVTSGEAAGRTHEEKLIIGEQRRNELLTSAKILGVKEVFFLGYEDGELKNNCYHQLADDISQKVEDLRPDTLMTFELRGVSGHTDHIAVAFITTFVFKRYSFLKKLMYYVTAKAKSEQRDDYFIYFPKGYEREEVDEIVNVEKVWETKVKAMHAHISQMKDVESVLKSSLKSPKEEYFLILEK